MGCANAAGAKRARRQERSRLRTVGRFITGTGKVAVGTCQACTREAKLAGGGASVNVFPESYRAEILAYQRSYLNDPSGIRSAAVGESLISPHIAGKVLQHVRATTAAPEAAATIRAELSDREIQVLKLIANGKDNGMIAGELHISPKTVKNHISNILMKLQIENRIQAAVYAVRSGIV